MKYSYIFEQDGITQLNLNVYENTEQQAQAMAQLTMPDINGKLIIIKNSDEFETEMKNKVSSLNVLGIPVNFNGYYVGYYYDTQLEAYVMRTHDIKIIQAPVINELAESLNPASNDTSISNYLFEHAHDNLTMQHKPIDAGIITIQLEDLPNLQSRIIE